MTLDICYEISFEISVRMLEKISDGTTENFSTRKFRVEMLFLSIVKIREDAIAMEAMACSEETK